MAKFIKKSKIKKTYLFESKTGKKLKTNRKLINELKGVFKKFGITTDNNLYNDIRRAAVTLLLYINFINIFKFSFFFNSTIKSSNIYNTCAGSSYSGHNI